MKTEDQAYLDESTPAIASMMREMDSSGVDYFLFVNCGKVFAVPRGEELDKFRDSVPRDHPFRKAVERISSCPSSPHARWVLLARETEDGKVVFSVCSVMEVDIAKAEGDA